MKKILGVIILFLTTSLFAQDLNVLEAEVWEILDFGSETQKKWKKREQLYDDLNSGEKTEATLTKEEKEVINLWDETYSSMWSVEGDGCSWYCGAGDYTVKTSSELSSNGELTYKTENLTDFNYKTAWVEGKPGYGIGEFITFKIPSTHPRITTIILVNGYVKSKKAWRDNSRVHELKMFINDKPHAIIKLKDAYAKQHIKLKEILGYSDREDVEELKKKKDLNVRFEIMSVFKGDKYDDTAITEMYFDGLDVHCLAKGTLITMADNSQKKIELLKKGDEVLSYNQKTNKSEASIITELASPVHKGLIKLDFSNGSSITCTKDHPFLSHNSQWISNDPQKTAIDYDLPFVVKLKKGSKVKSLNGVVGVVKITDVKPKQRTYTIVELSKNKSFFANGIVTGIEKLRVLR